MPLVQRQPPPLLPLLSLPLLWLCCHRNRHHRHCRRHLRCLCYRRCRHCRCCFRRRRRCSSLSPHPPPPLPLSLSLPPPSLCHHRNRHRRRCRYHLRCLSHRCGRRCCFCCRRHCSSLSPLPPPSPPLSSSSPLSSLLPLPPPSSSAVAVAAATTITATTGVVNCYVFVTPSLNFDGAGRRRRHPWPYQRAPLIITGADSPEVAVEAMNGGTHGFHATSFKKRTGVTWNLACSFELIFRVVVSFGLENNFSCVLCWLIPRPNLDRVRQEFLFLWFLEYFPSFLLSFTLLLHDFLRKRV